MLLCLCRLLRFVLKQSGTRQGRELLVRMNGTLPVMSVLVCTRNRGSLVANAVASILENSRTDFEIIVVDQSEDTSSFDALRRFRDDLRFHYIWRPPGHSAALNYGIALARAEYVPITDDDCEVAPNWLEELERVFAENPRVAVAFCNVVAGPHDSTRGFVPTFECRSERVIGSLLSLTRPYGIGAGMAVRRTAALIMGGFDEDLGPGARFPSAGDRDFAIRALVRGYEVALTNQTYVIHHGYRTWEEGRDLAIRDWTGVGGAYAKLLKVHQLVVPRMLLDLVSEVMVPPLVNLLKGHSPGGITRMLSFCRGFGRGFSQPIRRPSLVYSTSIGLSTEDGRTTVARNRRT